jgi:2-phospho-L-lactate transferase/gluconeogenesis factor (CofD/UPF0052 family)
VLVLNLRTQPGETDGFTPESHLEVIAQHAPGLELDVVLADTDVVSDRPALEAAAAAMGAKLVLAPLASADHPDQHDPDRLATAFHALFSPDDRPSDRI